MKSRKTGSLIVIALAAIGTVVLIGSRSAAIEAVYPIERARALFVGMVGPRIFGLFRGSAVSAENVRLRREVAELSLLRGDLDRLETENARLRRALDYTARQPEMWIAAGVLSRGGGAAGLRETLRVGKGTEDGVREGAVVVVPEGLVGRVTAVTSHTAEILLVSDPSLKVACEVESGSPVRARGILSGGTDDRLVLRYLGTAAQARPQSRVLTSGRGGVFTAGIEVGTLLTMTNGIRGVEGEVAPPVVYSTLEDVFIRRAR